MGVKTGLSNKTRNELCPCGSELKQKHCHGDPKKLQACNQIAQYYMIKLIREERKKRELESYDFTCEKCGKGTDQPRQSTIAGGGLVCPDEACGGVVVSEPKAVEDVPANKQEKKSIILEA